MTGVRKFDEDVVIDAVMRVFWEKGYEATAMADLAEAADVQRGSLYHAYGGKEELLLRALDRYTERPGGAARAALADPDMRRAIDGFLESHLARMEEPSNPAGCLMCQTALECGGRDPAISEKVREQFLRTEAALRATLDRGRDAGQLPDTADTTALARFFLGISRGMAVLHRAYGDLEAAHDMAGVALEALDRLMSDARQRG